VKRIFAGAVLALFFAGCSGGSSTVPNVPTQSQPKTTHGMRLIGHLNISRADAKRIALKVQRAGAHALPMAHGPVHFRQSRRAQTASAGYDLTNSGGPVMAGANVYNILVNAQDESTWGGKIAQFESDLFSSSMINILDQYIGQSATGAFTYGGDYTVTYDTSQQLADQDIFNIIYQVASQNNAVGYTNIYNVFFDSSVTQCSQAAGGCFNQDYCAYHGSTDYSDIGHVIYSFEGYQQGNCNVTDTVNAPNGVLSDSTASTLSHEMFESFTDADVAANNVAWYNNTLGEIGDICAKYSNNSTGGLPSGFVQLGSDNWEIQTEYSNNQHDCSFTL
jgi:hypothetical protein